MGPENQLVTIDVLMILKESSAEAFSQNEVAEPSRQVAGILWTYLSLFLAAFAAATILPMQSEALLAYHVTNSDLWLAGLFGVATLGNVLGSVVNWYCGRFLRRFRDRRWFPVTPEAMQRAEIRYHRYGRWSLLASWVPIIGDPLTVVAGILREPLFSFVLIVTVAKAARYLVVGAAALAWL